MKNNRLLVAISVILLSLTACHNTNKPSTPSESLEPSTPSESEVRDYLDERDYQYQNRIEEPSNIIHNMEDFARITDYHAFYKDVESFDVILADDYVYETFQKKINYEINYLYWYGELVNGVMGITGTVKNENTWNIQYVYYHNAFMDGHPTKQILNDLFYQEPVQTRNDDYNGFATEDVNKPIADVATTQQLWYAAEWGYRINPIPNSPAERYYNSSKELLRRIVDDGMTDYQKTCAIYDYIEHHASYCYEALDLPDSDDPQNFPDAICAQHKAFFIEGFFDNNTVVCDGFSKIYTLLGRMEGLEIVRGSGTSDTRWTTKEVAGHAYCFVNLDGKYYLSCPTWGQRNVDYRISNDNYYYLCKDYFLSPKSYMNRYNCTSWREFTYATSVNNFEYFISLSVTNDTTISGFVKSKEEAEKIVSLFDGTSKSFVDVLALSSSVKSQIISAARSAGLYVYAEESNSDLEVVLIKL